MKHRLSPLEIAALIRNAKARATPARVRVLGLLQSAPEPVSHAQLEEVLAAEPSAAIDRVTLYRVLDWLAETGLAHKAPDNRGVFRFSPASQDIEHTAHAHFRCTDCGGVFCLDMAPPKLPDLPEGFRLAGINLDIRGECARCVSRHL